MEFNNIYTIRDESHDATCKTTKVWWSDVKKGLLVIVFLNLYDLGLVSKRLLSRNPWKKVPHLSKHKLPM